MSLLYWLQFPQSAFFVPTLGQVHGEVCPKVHLIRMFGNFFPDQLDRMLVSKFGLLLLAGRPAVRVPQIAPTVEKVGVQLHRLFKS